MSEARAAGLAAPAVLPALTFLLGIVGTFAVVGVRVDARLAQLDQRIATLESEVSQLGAFAPRPLVQVP